MSDLQGCKALVRRFHGEIDGAAPPDIAGVLSDHVTADYHWRGMHPFHEQRGADAVAETFWQPFRTAVSSVQRRQDVFMAGFNSLHDTSAPWVCSMGHLMGLFDRPWLGIAPTGKMLFLRYAEFHRVEGGRICETALFCDLISVMMQAGLQPLPPQTGAFMITPGPQTHDGLLFGPQDAEASNLTLELINRMIGDLTGSPTLLPQEGLARCWHRDMIWFGPAGIGATYTLPRYRQQHQAPFRDNFEDIRFEGHLCRFAEGNYGGFFGWPNLTMRPTGGFLGMPGQTGRVGMRVVDIYRRDADKLAENWIFIDLLHYLAQQGLDLLGRMADSPRT